jgi:hypothetical protein
MRSASMPSCERERERGRGRGIETVKASTSVALSPWKAQFPSSSFFHHCLNEELPARWVVAAETIRCWQGEVLRSPIPSSSSTRGGDKEVLARRGGSQSSLIHSSSPTGSALPTGDSSGG